MAKRTQEEPAAEFTPTIAQPPAPPPATVLRPLDSYPPFLGKEEWDRQMAAKRGEIRTAEQWAEAKGFLPEFIELAQPFAAAGSPALQQHNAESWKFKATKAGHAWPEGKELTEAEFDAAVTESITGHTFR
jgi:hypothetical protein